MKGEKSGDDLWRGGEGKGRESKTDEERETTRRQNSLPHFRSLDDESSETGENLYKRVEDT